MPYQTFETLVNEEVKNNEEANNEKADNEKADNVENSKILPFIPKQYSYHFKEQAQIERVLGKDTIRNTRILGAIAILSLAFIWLPVLTGIYGLFKAAIFSAAARLATEEKKKEDLNHSWRVSLLSDPLYFVLSPWALFSPVDYLKSKYRSQDTL